MKSKNFVPGMMMYSCHLNRQMRYELGSPWRSGWFRDQALCCRHSERSRAVAFRTVSSFLMVTTKANFTEASVFDVPVSEGFEDKILLNTD
jgi:hypothetical protein